MLNKENEEEKRGENRREEKRRERERRREEVRCTKTDKSVLCFKKWKL